MSNTRHTTVLSSVVVLLLIGSLFIPVVYADDHDESTEPDRYYQIVQGDQVVSVDPIEGDDSVEEFYDYHHPHVGSRDDPRWGRSFSSEGTVEYQKDDTSVLLLYEGPEGVSLVALHDKYHETQTDGTTGGSVSWTVSGLPNDGEWAVIDDEYGWLTTNATQDDLFYVDPVHRSGAPGTDGEPPNNADALISWVWVTGRNDGVAYRGLGSDVSVSIDPAFNEESYHRYGDQRRANEFPNRPYQNSGYNGTVDDWQVIVPTSDGEEFDRVSLERLDEPVDIRSTSVLPTLRSVELENETIEPGDSLELTAVVHNPGDTEWSYETSFRVGDTVLQREYVTVRPGEEQTVTFTQEFESAGVYEVGVDGERTTLTVGDPETNDTDEYTGDTDGDTDDTGEYTDDTDGNTDDQIPGFGPVTAVVALLVATLTARRRLTR